MHGKERAENTVQQDCGRIQRIRARSSYLLSQELYEFLKKEPSTADILRKFYDILNARYAFGSERSADCAAESLEQVLKDNGEVRV